MKNLTPEIIAALIGGIIAIIIAIFQFFTNRRLNKEVEQLKRENEQQLEERRLQNELIQNIEIAKQEHLRQMVNETYTLRRSVEKLESSLHGDLVNIKDLEKYYNEVIQACQVVDKIYRSAVYLNSFLDNEISRFIHDLRKNCANLESEFVYKKRNANKVRDEGDKFYEAVIKFMTYIKNYEGKFKELMISKYSR